MLLAVFEKIRAISQNFRRGAEIRQQTLEKVFSFSENLLPWLEWGHYWNNKYNPGKTKNEKINTKDTRTASPDRVYKVQRK